ncbi:MAG: tRNA lysidine(34) synthetase TilS [Burkholderiales bacterium]|nr:tRNA lysidine(34) synthetase TilS [Burkholderiales bacterium]
MPRGARLTLALSGGIDSAVLLDLLAADAGRRGLRLACLHLNHGISPNAAAWARFCRRLAARYGLRCRVRKLDLAPYRALGMEAAAREARYAALRAEHADFVALAQHLDDQAETVLLQLVRGAGVPGLAAMPAVRGAGNGTGPRLVRPLLGVPRAAIETYARARGLEWIEDESNANDAIARNYVRHRVMPLLAELNVGAADNLARSARHLGEATALLADLAAIDAAQCALDGGISIAALRRLGGARARNLLRWYLQQHGLRAPSSVQLDEMLRQATSARTDRAVHFALGAATLRRYRDALWAVPPLPPPPPKDFQAKWPGGMAPWHVPDFGGVLRFRSGRGAGLRSAALRKGRVTLRARSGGEALRPRAGGPRRTVKRLLQEAGVPPWERQRLPLLYVDGRLACVPGVAVDAEWQAEPGEIGVVLEWTPVPLAPARARRRAETRRNA